MTNQTMNQYDYEEIFDLIDIIVNRIQVVHVTI